MLILQPVASRVHPQTENVVRQLAAQGHQLIRTFGGIGIDRVRCHLVSKALTVEPRQEWFFMMDSDMVCDASAPLRLLESAKQTGALFMMAPSVQRGNYGLNVKTGGSEILLGPDGGVIEVEKGAFALTVVHRAFFEALWDELPPVDYIDEDTGEVYEGRPFFLPMCRNRTHYGEDYSLSLRARDAGIRLYCDTRVENWHAGEVLLGWQDIRGAQAVPSKGGDVR